MVCYQKDFQMVNVEATVYQVVCREDMGASHHLETKSS